MSLEASGVLQMDRLSAVFKPGQTALGHRWLLRDGDDAEVGRTKLFYEGAGKTVGRLMRVTGLSQSGTLHAIVLGSDGSELVRVHSYPGKDAHVEVMDPSGTRIGRARRRDLSLELLGPDSDTTIGRITQESKEDAAFPVVDARGERLGVLAKQKLEMSAPSIAEMVFLPQIASNTIAFQATMHLGFAGAHEYHLLVEQRPHDTTLGALLALTPVIAAYAY